MLQGSYCWEKLHAGHSQWLKGQENFGIKNKSSKRFNHVCYVFKFIYKDLRTNQKLHFSQDLPCFVAHLLVALS